MSKYVSSYEELGNDFCKKYNVKMTITFMKHDRYFHDDKHYRNIYRIRIDRNHKTFSFNFGDSVYNTNTGKRPTKYDVGSFENFLVEYGYKIESTDDYHRMMKLYKKVKKEYKNVYRLFSDCMEELEEIC